MYSRKCEKCGAYLDPGESCSCESAPKENENVDRAAQLKLISNELEKLSDKDINLVKRFIVGLVARDSLERG